VQSSSQIITTNKPTSSFLQAGCPSCHPTNSVKALKGKDSSADVDNLSAIYSLKILAVFIMPLSVNIASERVGMMFQWLCDVGGSICFDLGRENICRIISITGSFTLRLSATSG